MGDNQDETCEERLLRLGQSLNDLFENKRESVESFDQVEDAN
jgi:hypothetical protein